MQHAALIAYSSNGITFRHKWIVITENLYSIAQKVDAERKFINRNNANIELL